MARLSLNTTRTEKTKKTYLGKMLLFCEGITEYNYFNHFARIINENRDKFSDIVIEFQKVGGNSKTVFEFANNYLNEASNSSKYHNYDKYLIFDCDDPSNIEEVIAEMVVSENCYELLLTNLLFETWLLMHFEEIEEPMKKKEIYKKMATYLNIDKYNSKEKSSEGHIRKIVNNGDNVAKALENAIRLKKKYEDEGYRLSKDIKKMNPFTTVNKLVSELLSEINYENTL